MALLIKGRRLAAESPRSPEEESREKVVRLEPSDDLEDLALNAVSRVEIVFPKFGEGRGYTLARLLRTRHRYWGELRAVGHITRDQLYFLEKAGFDAFELRDGEDPHAALAAFDTFSHAYQKL